MRMFIGYNFGKLSVAVIGDGVEKPQKEDWRNIDPATLPDDVRRAYTEYKDSYAVTAEFRKDFERKLRSLGGITTPVVRKNATRSFSLADAIEIAMQNCHAH